MNLRLVATLAAAALAVAGCGDDKTASTGPTTTTRPGITTTAPGSGATTAPAPTSAPSTTLAADRYRRFGSPATVADGFLVGASPDGSAAYVERVDPTLSRPGCEGQPEPVLFRVPLSGGAAEPVLAQGRPVRGLLVRGPAGKVALIAGCEEFLTTLRVATESADGRLTDLREVPVRDNRLVGFGWSADGTRLLAGRNGGTGAPPVVAVDLATGEVTELFRVEGRQFVTAVAEVAGGLYAVAGEGDVSLRDGRGAIRATTAGFGFAVAPDRSRIAAFGDALVVLTPGQAGPTPLATAAPGQSMTAATFSPDGRAVAYALSGDAGGGAGVATVADARAAAVPAISGRFVRVAFTGDGAALLLAVLASGGSAQVVRVPLGG